jgi:hypothetical protein
VSNRPFRGLLVVLMLVGLLAAYGCGATARAHRTVRAAARATVRPASWGTCTRLRAGIDADAYPPVSQEDPVLVTLTNTSRGTCRMDGYPKLFAEDRTGARCRCTSLRSIRPGRST